MKLHENLKKCILYCCWAEYSGICHVDSATVLIVLFSSSIFLMIFSLVILLLPETGVETPIIIVDMLISPLSLISFCFMYFEIQLFGCIHIKGCQVLLVDLSFYHYVIYSMSLIFFVPKSTLSGIVASGMHINTLFLPQK